MKTKKTIHAMKASELAKFVAQQHARYRRLEIELNKPGVDCDALRQELSDTEQAILTAANELEARI